MTTELKGRFATYFTGNRKAGSTICCSRMSLNAAKINFGLGIARAILRDKKVDFGDTHWFELELLPGEKNAEETAQEKLKKELCYALYGDLRQTYPSLTLAKVRADVDELLAGNEPTGIIQMFAQPHLIQLGLLKREV